MIICALDFLISDHWDILLHDQLTIVIFFPSSLFGVFFSISVLVPLFSLSFVHLILFASDASSLYSFTPTRAIFGPYIYV